MIRRANRFHGHSSVSKVHGAVVHGAHMSVRFAKNNRADYRMAVVISKKTAQRAVIRNRVRRRIFEAVRTQGRLSNLPVDVIFYIKDPSLAEVEAAVVQDEVAQLTKKVLAKL